MNAPQASNPSSPASNRWDRLFFAAFLFGLTFLGLVGGMLLAAFDTRAYAWTEDAVAACRALMARGEMAQEEYLPWLWQPVQYEAVDAQAQTDSEGQAFYCLYTSGADGHATLIDATGQSVHQWVAPFSKAISTRDPAKQMVPDNQINLRRGHVYPNGDLLALYETPTNTPSGMGLCRLQKNGTPRWSLDGNFHHDFCIDQDGTIFTLTHQLKKPDHPKSYFQGRICLEDFVTVVSAEGEVKQEFSLLQLYYDSPFYRPDILKRDHMGDLLHTNTINLIDQEFAQHYAEIEAGFLMVCFRNINLVAVIDPAAEKIVWAISGPWHFPHDPDPLPNGNVLVFDNCYDQGSFVGSRSVEFDPRSSQVAWQTRGPESAPMRSDIRSTQQLLSNGNVLICDSNGGRMLEMTRDQQLVWQFYNPTSVALPQGTLRPILTGVVRYEATELPFLHAADKNQLADSSRIQP